MQQMLVLADDLSGAADCGVACTGCGLHAVVLLDGTASADVLAVDADTRHLPPSAAAERMVQLLQTHDPAASRLLYKKIDSTLRGNVAAELAAILNARRAALPDVRVVAVFAPAFPASGRTTIAGRQHVHGKLLEHTELWHREQASPCSDIAAMLREASLTSSLLSLDMVRADRQALRESMQQAAAATDVLVCDAETEKDLLAIVEASLSLGPHTLWVGSAGMAYLLPRAAQLAAGAHALPAQALATGPTLFVVGSVSSISREQAKLLAASSSVVEVRIPPETLLSAGKSSEAYLQQLREALTSGRDALVLPDSHPQLPHRQGHALSVALARLVVPLVELAGAIVVTGGETARALLERLGISRLHVIGEFERALPFSIAEIKGRRLPIITKSGAFGRPTTLLHCHEFLHSLDRSALQEICLTGETQ